MRVWRRLILLLVFSACGPGGRPVDPETFPKPCLGLTPGLLDFGEVENLRAEVRSFNFQNNTQSFLDVRVGAAPAPFFFGGLTARLAPGEIGGGTVGLVNDDGLLHVGAIEFDAGPECHTTLPVRALGKGKLSHAPELPSILDFGFVPVGESKTLEVSFINSRRVPVTISKMSVTSPVFTFSGPERIEVPAVSTLKIPITATPSSDSDFNAVFVADTGETIHQVQMLVIAGAPKAALRETALVIPTVGYSFPSSPPSFATRAAALKNVSTQGRSPFAALRLVAPQVEVESLGEGSVHELSVTLSDQFLLGIPLGAEAAIELRLVPTSTGLRRFRITLFTNDPMQPRHSFTLEANVQALAECQLTVTPMPELVLTRNDAGISTGDLFFTNTGATPCVVDDLRLDRVEASYQLTGVVPQARIAAGASHTVTVSTPSTAFGTSAQLRFHLFNADSDVRHITIRSPPP